MPGGVCEYPSLRLTAPNLSDANASRPSTTDFRGTSRQCLLLMLDPNGHTRLEACRLSLGVETQA
jgi:hypothetical protein